MKLIKFATGYFLVKFVAGLELFIKNAMDMSQISIYMNYLSCKLLPILYNMHTAENWIIEYNVINLKLKIEVVKEHLPSLYLNFLFILPK